MNKKLNDFEHGQWYITLERCNETYIVSLYKNDVLVRSWDTTTLDAACEMYSLTCKQAVVQG